MISSHRRPAFARPDWMINAHPIDAVPRGAGVASATDRSTNRALKRTGRRSARKDDGPKGRGEKIAEQEEARLRGRRKTPRAQVTVDRK
jgi:hypothetical protein